MNIEKSSNQKQRPEAVAEFAESARHESSGKDAKK